MINNCLLFCLAILMAVVTRASAQEWVNTSGATNAPDFSKLSYDEASDEALSESVHIMGSKTKKIGPQYIANLVNQLRQGNLDDDKKVVVIWLLGELRASDTNAIEMLIKNIDLKASKLDPLLRIRRWGEYPAEEALENIGMPVVDPVFSHLSTESKGLRRHLMCKALIQVEGKIDGRWNVNQSEALGKQFCKQQLNQMLSNESDPAKKANIELALKELVK